MRQKKCLFSSFGQLQQQLLDAQLHTFLAQHLIGAINKKKNTRKHFAVSLLCIFSNFSLKNKCDKERKKEENAKASTYIGIAKRNEKGVLSCFLQFTFSTYRRRALLQTSKLSIGFEISHGIFAYERDEWRRVSMAASEVKAYTISFDHQHRVKRNVSAQIHQCNVWRRMQKVRDFRGVTMIEQKKGESQRNHIFLHLLFWVQKQRFLLQYLCKQKPMQHERGKGGEIKYALHIRMHASTRQTFLIPNGEPNSVVSALKNHYVYTVGTYIFAYCVIFDFFGNHCARIVIS